MMWQAANRADLAARAAKAIPAAMPMCMRASMKAAEAPGAIKWHLPGVSWRNG